jgi:NAD(P)-dependent dehydrogenase (short-subunit alcohol dehydrogenase family)
MAEIAIVTGAASGIGYATVDELLGGDPEMQVVGADLRDGWASEFAERHGRERVHEVVVDVTDHDGVRRAVDDTAERVGTPTQLVNCAGIQYNCAALDLTIEGWRNLMAINLDGSFSFCQAAGRHMVAAGRGAIVNLASVSMNFGFPRRLPYIVSKCGIGGLTQTLAVEWGEHNVRVNAVSPGYVETKLLTDAFDAGQVDRGRVSDYAALNRIASPAEIAGVIRFLLSDEAGFITGTIVDVDGGLRRKKV